MKVIELMEKQVKTVKPEATLAEVIVSLADTCGAALPVVDQVGRLLGFISETELMRAKVEDEETFMQWVENTPVRNIMAARKLTVRLVRLCKRRPSRCLTPTGTNFS
jgi:CBS domain-containing protein